MYFNFNDYKDENNFYVNNPDKILEMLTGKKWSIRKEYDVLYTPEENEYVIEWWTTNGKTGHFAMERQGFNTLQNSYICKNGRIGSLRILKVIK